ncbi:hypothetical protein [Ferrimonas marina]|uniref:Uncharacterized protein n=1 Tax=Ferrimonas marina TaxID=299255 RepID=A0A1M5U0G2_9GAMM|nr:hypothetical protein [Ferrimonas marina]SHH56565.1 hypothetical protein SAMN02745129_2357 [Ferrimonas marina]
MHCHAPQELRLSAQQFKALLANSNHQRKEAIRRRLCSVLVNGTPFPAPGDDATFKRDVQQGIDRLTRMHQAHQRALVAPKGTSAYTDAVLAFFKVTPKLGLRPMYEMIEAGHTPAQIGRALGLDPSNVSRDRKKYRLARAAMQAYGSLAGNLCRH